MQRRYFIKVEQGATEQLRGLQIYLRRKLTKKERDEATEWLAKTEKLLEAARVKPMAGRLPVNHRYAGKAVPADRLPEKYRTKGLRFTEDGYPDFGPYAQKLPNGKMQVEIKLTGSMHRDFRIADQAAGFAPGKRPAGFTWHHHQDGKTMMLVPDDLHTRVRHTGGRASYRHQTGDLQAYD